MRVLAIVLSILFSAGIFCEAAEEVVQVDIDKSVISGTQWQKFSKGEKWVYLFGYEDGARNTALHFISNNEKKDSIYAGLPMQIKGESTISDLISQIDMFYSDESNKNIPINCVFLVIKNRKTGVQEDKIQRYIESVRQDPGETEDF